jgi:hypothetical protein
MYRSRLVVRLLGLSGLIALAGSAAVGTQPANPPPPDKYKAAVRYYIPAQRDQHVALYKAMIGHLDKLGFEFQPKLKPFPNTDYEDPNKNILTGFVAPDKALACLRNPSVAALLLMPANFQIPDDPTAPVRVRLELASGFPEPRQVVLSNQVRALLGQLDFRESVGYDNRGYSGRPFTRLVGTIPAEHLDTLLKDLRSQPTGWLAPRIDAQTLPSPISQVVPIVVTEVLAEPGPAKDLPPTEKRGQDYLNKISSDLWTLVVSKDDETKIVRAEIMLSYVPAAGDESFRDVLVKAAPSLFIEGRLGAVVTALLRVNQASGLAGLPQVSVVRLARPALVSVDPSVKLTGDNAKALKLSGLADLHDRGFKGKGVRVAIVDSDFRGHDALVQSGKLPKATRFVDLTTEYNSDIVPDPSPGDDKSLGHGTHCALAAVLAAPEAELTLIRIDPASLPQLQLVARIINGEPALDDHLARRIDELRAASQALVGRREELIKERQAILDNFEDELEIRRQYEVLGPAVRGWLFSSRDWHLRRMAELERDRELQRRVELRFQRFYDQLLQLKGIHVVATSLVWNDGYPLAGSSPLSRWFDEEGARKALWFVSAGNTAGQTWTGLFRDVDANGVMEFAAPAAKLPPGAWTPELNFLAWQPYQGDKALELPEGARVRVTMQWREPHDPSFFWRPDERDRYLKPLAEMNLVVLKQRDPAAKELPADDFEVVGRSAVPAQRLENQPGGATYEQVVEFTVTKPGRYALRVERQLPTRWELQADPATGQAILVERGGLAAKGIRPVDAASLPALEAQWELRPRIFVSVIDQATSAKGRVLFRDFYTNQGSIPILADARSLIAVGAASLADEPQPYTAAGAPGTLWNFMKPNILTNDGLLLTPQGTGSAFGASLATPFASGMAATLLSTGVRPAQLQAHLQKQQGIVWHLSKK